MAIGENKKRFCITLDKGVYEVLQEKAKENLLQKPSK